MRKKFRLPRKIKKKLQKGFWLYEPDEQGNSLQANPGRSQEDYAAFKQGKLRNILTKRIQEKEGRNSSGKSMVKFMSLMMF